MDADFGALTDQILNESCHGRPDRNFCRCSCHDYGNNLAEPERGRHGSQVVDWARDILGVELHPWQARYVVEVPRDTNLPTVRLVGAY